MLARLQRLFVFAEMAKYLVAGGLAFLADATLLFVLTEQFSIHYLLSNTAGFSVGLIVSYSLNIKWVFSHRKYEFRVTTELPLFIAIVLTGYLISQLVMWFAVEAVDVNYMIGKVGSTGFVLVFNFTAKKFLLFTKTS